MQGALTPRQLVAHIVLNIGHRVRERVRRGEAIRGASVHGHRRPRAGDRRVQRSGAWLVGLLAVGNAVLGMALGLFVSAFARTEFQAVQFMPAIIFPQLLLCGLFVDRHEMASALYGVSWVLPLTYAYDALARATRSGALGSRMAIDICVILGATLVALALGALTLRRRTP
jgi:hypothetical protein